MQMNILAIYDRISYLGRTINSSLDDNFCAHPDTRVSGVGRDTNAGLGVAHIVKFGDCASENNKSSE